MTFPTRTGLDHGASTSGARTLSMSALATGSLVGDVVCCCVSLRGNPSIDTTSTGWDKEGQVSDATGIVTYVLFTYVVTVAGTVTDLALTYSTGSSPNYAYSNRMRSSTGALTMISPVTASGSSSNPDPPALTNPDTLSRDIRVLAGFAGDGPALGTGGIASYVPFINASTGTSAPAATLFVADRTVTIASGGTENPSNITRTNEQWVAFTFGWYEASVSVALTVAGTNSASQTTAPTLSPKTALSVAGANSASQADNVTLSPKTTLTVAGANSASQASGPILFVSGTQGANSASQAGGDGPELVVNGTFGVDASSWLAADPPNMTVASVGGRLRVTEGTAAIPYAYQQVTLVPGQVYHLRLDVFGGTASAVLNFGTNQGGNTGGTSVGVGPGNTGAVDFTFTAAQTTYYISCWANSSTNGLYSEFDNISLKQVGQPITLLPKTALTVANTNSASQASAAPITLRFSLAVANDNSASQAGAVTLANAHYTLTAANANSASQASTVAISSHILYYIKAGIDATTADSLATNPGTIIYKGDLNTLTYV